jgi:hypothetical protein
MGQQPQVALAAADNACRIANPSPQTPQTPIAPLEEINDRRLIALRSQPGHGEGAQFVSYTLPRPD